MTALWSLLAALAVMQVKAEDDYKPIITQYPEGKMRAGLEKHLPLHKWEISPWLDGGAIPRRCKEYAEGEKLNPVDIEVSDVKFDDCDEPWVFCRHKDAQPLEQLVKSFAWLPVQGRSAVGHVMAVPGGASGFSVNDDVVLKGDAHSGYLWHEASHTIDHWCSFPDQGEGKKWSHAHQTDTWLEADRQDSHRTEDYGNTGGQVENFAQALVHSMYDINVPGGLKGLCEELGITTDGKPNWELYQNKVRVQSEYCKAQITASTNDRCDRKVKSSEPVPKEDKEEEKPQDVTTRDGLVPDDRVMEGYPGGRFNEDYAKHLPKHPAQIESWKDYSPDQIPRYCYDNTKAEGHEPNDVEVFSLFYDDCDEDWIMCRHKDAPWSIEQLAERFGMLPVRARGHVANVLLLPLQGTAASTAGGGVMLKGDVDLGTLYHEVGHAVDSNCPFPGKNGNPDSHKTQAWMDAFNKDGWVPDPQSNSGMAEDFTQVYLHALYDVNIPGGLPSIGTQTNGKNNWDLIKNQMDVQKQYCKAELTAGMGDKCEGKKRTTDIIMKDGSEGPFLGGSRKRGPKRVASWPVA